MGILKRKKVVMQGVRGVFLLCLALCNTFCSAQRLKGTYQWVGPAGLMVAHIDLEADHTFRYSSQGDFGGRHYSGGYHLTRGDTLLLFHTKVPRPDSSYYKIVEQRDSSSALGGMTKAYSSDVAILYLAVTDLDDAPLLGANVALLSQAHTVSLYNSDTLGEVYIRTEGQVVDRLNIFYRFHRNLEIDLTNFWGHSTKLKVYLTDNSDTYNQEEFLSKYLIEENKEGLQLHRVGSRERFTKLAPGEKRKGPAAYTGG